MKSLGFGSSRVFKKVGVLLALSCVGSLSLYAAPVDSEIVILVDAQTFSAGSFDLALEGVARAFEQQSFVDSVASGPFGAVAASVLVFGSNGTTTEVPSTNLSSESDLSIFADAVRSVTQPPSFGTISYVDAISTAAASLAASSAEGTLRQLTVIEDGAFFLFNNTAAEISAARDVALANSFDVINSVVYNAGVTGGARADAIEGFYNANVVGGGPGGEVEVVTGSLFGAPAGAVGEEIANTIAAQVSQPTVEAVTLASVPEPSTLFLGGLSFAVLLVRRRS